MRHPISQSRRTHVASVAVALLVLGAGAAARGDVLVGPWRAANDLDPGPETLHPYADDRDWCWSGTGIVTVRTDHWIVNGDDAADVLVQRYDAEGTPVGEAVKANHAPTRYMPTIACAPGGDVVVSWTDYESERRTIRAYDEAGSPLSDAAQLEDITGCYSPAMALSDDHMLVVACYEEGPLYQGEHLDALVFDLSGTRLGKHESFFEGDGGNYGPPDMAVDDAGHVVILDRRGRARVLTSLAEGGAALGDPLMLGAWRVVAEDTGLFRMLGYDGVHGGYIGSQLALDRELPAAPSSAMPAADDRFVRETVAAGPWRFFEWDDPQPRVAATPGGWLLTQVENHPDLQTWSLNTQVTVRRSSDNGRTWSEPQALSAQYEYGVPAIAADSAGHAIVAWHFVDEYESGVLFSSSADGGRHWSDVQTAQPIHEDDRWCDHQTGSPARVATDGAGTWVVAWGSRRYADDCENLPTVNDRIVVAHSSDDGATWTTDTVAENMGYGAAGLDVTFDGDGSWIVAWADVDAYAARSGDGGKTWKTPRTLATAGAPTSVQALVHGYPDTSMDYGAQLRRGLSLASDARGTVLAAWTSVPFGSENVGRDADIVTARTSDGGRSWSAPTAIASYAATDSTTDDSPTLLSQGDHLWVGAWRSFGAGGGANLDADILVSRSVDDGRHWSPARFANREAPTDSRGDHAPSLAGNAAGVTMLAWSKAPTLPLQPTPERPYGSEPGEGAETHVATSGDRCGNGLLESGEVCDDGNAVEGDGCDSNCTHAGCGNGVVDPGEECDDGNASDEDACTSGCTSARCGDAVARIGWEQCDDGNTSNEDDCVEGCKRATCGDGFVGPDEECDDANDDNTDSCTDSCRLPACGDGFVQAGEECDDGNLVDMDGCTAHCTIARCGDGSTDFATEECDYGNPRHAPFCSADCRIVTCPDNNGDQVVNTSDASRVLRSSVGLTQHCPSEACDTDGDGHIDATDAGLTLRAALAIPAAQLCTGPRPHETGTLSFYLLDTHTIGALQLSIKYPLALDLLRDPAGKLHCKTDIDGLISAYNSSTGSLDAGFVAINGFTGPGELFHCTYFTVDPGTPDLYTIDVVDVSDPDFHDIVPTPKIVVQISH